MRFLLCMTMYSLVASKFDTATFFESNFSSVIILYPNLHFVIAIFSLSANQAQIEDGFEIIMRNDASQRFARKR